jgi:hypothetical protein
MVSGSVVNLFWARQLAKAEMCIGEVFVFEKCFQVLFFVDVFGVLFFY